MKTETQNEITSRIQIPPHGAGSSWKKVGAIVIPTYNEADTICQLLDAVREKLPLWTIVVVDDSSPDGTGELVLQWLKTRGNGCILQNEAKAGLGNAYDCGFRFVVDSGIPLAIQMDADFSHDPKHLQEIASALGSESVVVASRYLKRAGSGNQDYLSKMLFSRAANVFLRFVLGRRLSDWTSGFKGYTANALRTLTMKKWSGKQFSFQFCSLFWLVSEGFEPKEIPIGFLKRKDGKSKNNVRVIFFSLLDALSLLCLKFKPRFK